MANRFQKLREEGSKGKRSKPLILEEFQWENEWIDTNAEKVLQEDDLTWSQLDEAIGATVGSSRNLRSSSRSQPNRALMAMLLMGAVG